MSFKHVIFGLCITAAALTATVTTVSAAGREAGLSANSTHTMPIAASPAAMVGAAAAGPARSGTVFTAPTASFEASTPAAEEALPASSLAVLALAAMLSVGLLMTRRSDR